MAGKISEYIAVLQTLPEWDAYLLSESHLPGPRANLELAAAVAQAGDEPLFLRLIESYGPQVAPVNTPAEFLSVCGVVGLGRLLAEDRAEQRQGRLARLRQLAADPRWRTREAVAIALQTWGDHDPDALFAEMHTWIGSDLLVGRAAAAAVCEPRLLKQPRHARQALEILDELTRVLLAAPDRRSEPVRVLRLALSYGWSVAAVALPEVGKPAMQRWLASPDPLARQIMAENLKKNRLARMDPQWVAQALQVVKR